MKRSLVAGLLVFLLFQNKAIIAQVPDGSKGSNLGTNSTTDDTLAAVASMFDQLSGADWEPRVNQLPVRVQMVRARKIPTLALTLLNKANVPAKTVNAAKTEVEKIYRQAGVEVVWNSTGHRDQSNTIQVTVVIVRNCVNKKTCDDPFAAGTL